MSNRYTGGIISATPPTLVAGAGASGTWTLEQQMQANAAGLWPVNAPFYIEDVFSTWLYTGTGASQTHPNGIDLAGKGGLVWLKRRSGVESHYLQDSSSSFANSLVSNTTAAAIVGSGVITSVSSTGFTTSSVSSGTTYASWTFRKQPKFFDVVTWTGNNATSRQISHSLGSTPGCIIVKCTNASANWVVYHKDLSTDSGTVDSNNLVLNSTGAQSGGGCFGDDAYQTSTYFTLGRLGSGFNDTFNKTGNTYVAYLFAHNAGGFGLSGEDNVISCGSYTGTGAAGNFVSLGYEPQWLLIKRTNTTGNWLVLDNMRGIATGGVDAGLFPNLSNAEDSANDYLSVNATGFELTGVSTTVNASGSTYIYIAIRRGPMKVPESGTSVYTSTYGTGSSNPAWISGFPVDFSVDANIGGGSTDEKMAGARLLQGTYGVTNTTAAWASLASQTYDFQNGFRTTNNGATDFAWMFRRAPSFMDVVCRNGTGANATQAHNLAVSPELVITKKRSAINEWYVTHSFTASGYQRQYLEQTAAASSHLYSDNFVWTAQPTTSSLFFGSNSNVNQSGQTFVDYLFATCPGVSKVGSYTGTGATQQINCGFTGGARFVLVKATSTTGNWMVWDSTRGIVAGNDPFVVWNNNLGETTNTDWVDTAATGFELSSAGGNLANSNGVSYIFLAIA